MLRTYKNPSGEETPGIKQKATNIFLYRSNIYRNC